MSFFSAANPAMDTGGFVDYPKSEVYQLIPPQYLPQTCFIKRGDLSLENVLAVMRLHELHFPVIFKPDRGERGFGVAKLKQEEDILNYIEDYRHIDQRFILQEYVDAPVELGILYYRFPHERIGNISSVVQKELPQLIGNGKSTLEELIVSDQRAVLNLKLLKEKFQDRLHTVIPKDEVVPLVEIGNHCKGATFLNANVLINQKLIRVIDHISWQIDGFYFGRFDLKVPNLHDLYAGRNIKIIELNGANSEPAHIYDPNMPLFRAYYDLFRHWQRLYEVSVANHRRGIGYMPFAQLLKKLVMHQKLRNSLKDNSRKQRLPTGNINKS
ncbi:hypothetical protein WJR50_16240 [Catalinimonas sp. 4WD22]|uniref:hypothetical protein n=1 Tax=Catalinimonas locisalis TaxID=3133978 RepID=UPI003100E70F